MTKYGNRRTNGYASAKEDARARDLRMLERAGEITDLREQVRFVLYGRDGALKGPSGRLLVYVADFTYTEAGAPVVEDAKGVETPVFRLKRAILAAQGVTVRTS